MPQRILNLTQHLATPDQTKAGVVDMPAELLPKLRELLTFDTLPMDMEVSERAHQIAQLAADTIERLEDHSADFFVSCMIGGAPYLMAPLELALSHRGLTAVYAFSVRESVETRRPDGTVEKRTVFKHAGFVPALFNGRF